MHALQVYGIECAHIGVCINAWRLFERSEIYGCLEVNYKLRGCNVVCIGVCKLNTPGCVFTLDFGSCFERSIKEVIHFLNWNLEHSKFCSRIKKDYFCSLAYIYMNKSYLESHLYTKGCKIVCKVLLHTRVIQSSVEFQPSESWDTRRYHIRIKRTPCGFNLHTVCIKALRHMYSAYLHADIISGKLYSTWYTSSLLYTDFLYTGTM